MALWTKNCDLWRFFLCSLFVIGLLAVVIQEVKADEQDIPSESQCRPYIEKALKNLETSETQTEDSGSKEQEESGSEEVKSEVVDEDSSVEILNDKPAQDYQSEEQQDEPSVKVVDEIYEGKVEVDDVEVEAGDSEEDRGEDGQKEGDTNEASCENCGESNENKKEGSNESGEQGDSNEASAEENKSDKDDADGKASEETQEDETVESDEKSGESAENTEENQESEEETEDSDERTKRDIGDNSQESVSKEVDKEGDNASVEGDSKEADGDYKEGEVDAESQENEVDSQQAESNSQEVEGDSKDADAESIEHADGDSKQDDSKEAVDGEESQEKDPGNESDSKEDSKADEGSKEDTREKDDSKESKSEESGEKEQGDEPAAQESGEEEHPEEDLLMEIDIPENLRPKDHITQILRLDEESTEAELLIEKSADIILRELKRLYDNAIKPLEILYKYRDLSNRHFGDPEIFSKPLVLFMGPWSGGKSSLINYLTDNEFTEWSLRTGAEPSPAYFNILMYGTEPQVLDGTQLAADWTFSGLQKFGQGLEERLRGLKLPSKLLEKVNIVEIPGILEVRKQVSRVFPFNDACQWFIDRADIIFLVYDPSKLDVGPETEAILDQLKGRESQTRIILNKADLVKPEELMRVQSALIWNISPLMSSAQPPIMYTTSLWSLPYQSGAPARLLQAQEKTFLKDLREAIDKRVDNKIASARRFAVRVRNHAKMVDCYLTTYYNHKTIFGNKKVVAEAIIEHPQNYHIYEGLSTLTNISRYDLPDPETYRDFFRLNPLYDFQQLSATCTYFRGCPINRLDIAIAYDLPELVGKYKKMVESATPQGMPKS